MDADSDDALRRRREHENELRWKRYDSPSRRRLAEVYRRSPGDELRHEGLREGHELDEASGRE